MSVSHFIKTTALSVCLMGASAAGVQARDLTPDERRVCSSLRVCIDITSRHDASEFDYAVLEASFRQFGPRGKQALFGLLSSEDGQADIARMIANLGPLTAQDRQRIQAKWTPETAQVYLPLLLDSHPMSRDLLLQSLGHPDAAVREQVRAALIRLPQNVQRAPLSQNLQAPLLAALLKDPIAEAAPYLARLNAAGSEKQFAALLRSGDSDIVTAAYSALYRNNPAQAFNTLLAEMERFETSAQARAVGHMLATRHKSRRDGFYLKFARDMSGDSKLSPAARASGLHGLLTIAEGPIPELTPARAQALSFLVKGQPFLAQDDYLPLLEAAQADKAMDLIWNVARTEKWINRDRIAAFYVGHRANDAVTNDLLQSNDFRSFSAGLRRAKPVHQRLIRSQIDHPVNAIASAARQTLKLPASRIQKPTCSIRPFDLDDMQAQMPFFEGGWMIAENKARMALSRADLTTAHPSASGWLAGYDLRKSGPDGGTVLHYDNKSGDFKIVGDFAGPQAILPGKALPLGQTTTQFWVIDAWGGDSDDISAYMLDIGITPPRAFHAGALPKAASGFSVTPNGDLLIAFDDKTQSPLRLTKTGVISSACASNPAANSPRAPQ